MTQELREAEHRLADYAQKNRIISLNPAENTVVARLAGLNGELLPRITISAGGSGVQVTSKNLTPPTC